MTVMDQIQSMKERQNIEAQAPSEVAVPTGGGFQTFFEGQLEATNREHSADIQRILELPIIDDLTLDQVELINKYAVNAAYYSKTVEEGGFRLFNIQAKALFTYATYNGAFCPITVGGGKTLTSLLIANEAYVAKGISTTLLIIPSNLVAQLRDKDLGFYTSRCNISTPVYFVKDMTSHERKLALARSGKRGCYVMTFHDLQSSIGEDLLNDLDPELIIIDEAHNLSATRQSARSKRFNNFLVRREPQVVAMSGTMTKSSPMEYYSLAKHALEDNLFLPLMHTQAETWAQAIGSDASGTDFADGSIPDHLARELQPLVIWARDNHPKETFDRSLAGFRKAFAYRLCSSPGVVSTGDDYLDIELRLINQPHTAPSTVEGWDTMQDLLRDVIDTWTTPSGEELECAMHVWRWRFELEGAGFYNELYWPDQEWIQRYKGTTMAGAELLLERSKEYHLNKQEYSRELRDFIKYRSKKNLDTPALIGGNMHNHGDRDVGSLLYSLWVQMKNSDFDGRLDRLGRSVRVCPFKIIAAVNWAKQLMSANECGIVWFYSAEVGRWLRDFFEEAGVPFVYCPAGDKYNSLILDEKHKKDGKFIIASLTAHGTGKNLQHYQYARLVQLPREAKTIEQLLGRTHRNGQLAPWVETYLDVVTEFDTGSFSKLLNDAAYIHQTLLNSQRLIESVYDPMPELMPYEVMKQWGLVGGGQGTKEKKVIKQLEKSGKIK